MSNEFVMVPRDWAQQVVSAGPGECVSKSDIALLIDAMTKPAEHSRGEPAALPERKVFTSGLLSESNTHNRGWNACLDEIAKLGPLYTRPVQGEPVAWSRVKPATPGAYWVRGNGLSRPALIEVVHEYGDLRCNLHDRTTCDDFGFGYSIERLSEEFEFCGPLFTRADPGEVERLKSIERSYGLRKALLQQVKGERDRMIARTLELAGQLAERDELLRELAEAAEMFSCSAHCETSDAGDALELLNKILARVNSHKAPKCKVCGYMLHPDGYCSFRDCGVPGKGTKALSASAEPSAPVEIDERAEFDAWTVRKGRVVGYCGWREDFAIWQARAALERQS